MPEEPGPEGISVAAQAEWEAIQFQIVKRLRMLQALETQRSPIHQRTTTIHADGSRTMVDVGSPLVWQSRLGLLAPIDDEHAVEEDRIYRRDDWTTSDVEGRTIAVSRLTSRPRVDRGPSLCKSDELPLPSRAMLASAASFPVRVALEDLRARAISARRLRRKQEDVREGGEEEEPVGRPDGLSESFLCSGRPLTLQSSPPDSATCAGAPPNARTPFQDSRVAAINAYSYLDDGYDGAGDSASGGLAAWAMGYERMKPWIGAYIFQSVPHVVICVVEASDTSFPDPFHVAFRSVLGSYRVRYFLGNFVLGNLSLTESIEFSSKVSVSRINNIHGTATAGVAMASTT
ncbi:MAG TPA: hypothetical protein PKY30_14205, partial [Myxococcota bacterium]|nr:hypothetical protein [Myxococcota bacterium]